MLAVIERVCVVGQSATGIGMTDRRISQRRPLRLSHRRLLTVAMSHYGRLPEFDSSLQTSSRAVGAPLQLDGSGQVLKVSNCSKKLWMVLAIFGRSRNDREGFRIFCKDVEASGSAWVGVKRSWRLLGSSGRL